MEDKTEVIIYNDPETGIELINDFKNIPPSLKSFFRVASVDTQFLKDYQEALSKFYDLSVTLSVHFVEGKNITDEQVKLHNRKVNTKILQNFNNRNICDKHD